MYVHVPSLHREQGDLTRYGERKFRGMMKDGYNSAHRYYQNLFRDAYRQVLMGKYVYAQPWNMLFA